MAGLLAEISDQMFSVPPYQNNLLAKRPGNRK